MGSIPIRSRLSTRAPLGRPGVPLALRAAENQIKFCANDPGQTGEDNRRFLSAVLDVSRPGILWRDLPERYGKWNSVWRRYDRSCASGVWEAVAEVLGEPDLEELQLDSTKVHTT